MVLFGATECALLGGYTLVRAFGLGVASFIFGLSQR
jgi:hypothetical protein